MTVGLRMFRLRGAPVVADASAVILALVFAGAVLVDVRMNVDVGAETDWIVAVVAGLVMVGCVLVHEASHAAVAAALGLKVRSIRVYIFGGYTVIDGRPSARDEVLVAVMGPVASLLLAGGFWILGDQIGLDGAVGRAASALALANAAIGVVNLFPGFPLDGGRVLRGLLSLGKRSRVRATVVVARIGGAFGLVLVGAGLYVLFNGYLIGTIVALAGWFLSTAARTVGRREELSASFDGLVARDAMREVPEAVPGSMVVAQVLDWYSMGPRLRSLPVAVDGRVVGVVGQEEIESVAPSRWPSTPVRKVMTPIGPADCVDVDEPLESLLLRPAGSSRRAVVLESGVVVGVIEGSDLGRVLPR